MTELQGTNDEAIMNVMRQNPALFWGRRTFRPDTHVRGSSPCNICFFFNSTIFAFLTKFDLFDDV